MTVSNWTVFKCDDCGKQKEFGYDDEGDKILEKRGWKFAKDFGEKDLCPKCIHKITK
jgi:hypothetical protein